MVRIPLHSPVELAKRKEHSAQQQLPMEPSPFRVLADDRERTAGWRFDSITRVPHGSKSIHRVHVEVDYQRIVTADYTIRGMESRVLIERKEVGDFLSSITHGRDRFEREHERMMEVFATGGIACVIIEGSLHDLPSDRDINLSSILGTQSNWYARFRIPWFFQGSRAIAERLAYNLLCEAWSRRQREIKEKHIDGLKKSFVRPV